MLSRLIFEHLVEIRRSDANDVIFKFAVDFPLERHSANFDGDLLFALNLLQENVGAADVSPQDVKATELLSTLNLIGRYFRQASSMKWWPASSATWDERPKSRMLWFASG
jgi:hypothetical protein